MGRTLDRASPPHTEMNGDAKSVWAAPWNPRFFSLSLASEAKRGKMNPVVLHWLLSRRCLFSHQHLPQVFGNPQE